MCLPMLAAGAIGYKQFENSKKKKPVQQIGPTSVGVTEASGSLPGTKTTDLIQKR